LYLTFNTSTPFLELSGGRLPAGGGGVMASGSIPLTVLC